MSSGNHKALILPTDRGWFREFSSGEVLFMELGTQTLIVVSEGTSPKCYLALLPDVDSTSAEWLETITDRVRSLSSDELVVKILGPESQVTAVAKRLVRAGAHRIVRCPLTGPKTEVLVYSASGRVRFAAETTTAAATRRRRILIVDDSNTMRRLLRRILSEDPRLEVVGDTGDPRDVEALIGKLQPDVLTLDINMPEIDGITLLHRLTGKYAIPAVMVSAVSFEQAFEVLRALELGAVDYIEKPSLSELDAIAPLIRQKVHFASHAKVAKLATQGEMRPALNWNRTVQEPVVIGASTGGVDALRKILIRLPNNIPPMIVAQHIPATFSRAFAQRLNELCPFEVKEAADGDILQPGSVLICPGGMQTKLVRNGDRAVVRLQPKASRDLFAPCIDDLFNSSALALGKNALGIILTGMGDDGARGLLAMRRVGAQTVAQDEASSVVFGMPKAAIQLGAAQEVVPLQEIADRIAAWCQGQRKAA